MAPTVTVSVPVLVLLIFLSVEKLDKEPSSSASSSSSRPLEEDDDEEEEDEKSSSSTLALKGSNKQRTLHNSCCPAKVACHSLLRGMVKTRRISGGSRKVKTWAIISDPKPIMGVFSLCKEDDPKPLCRRDMLLFVLVETTILVLEETAGGAREILAN